MSETTIHGENIANQIQGEDAYGCGPGKLTYADVWLIIDNLHTHFLDTNRDTKLFSKWMRELESIDDDLPCL
jgi:hypothetical protein